MKHFVSGSAGFSKLSFRMVLLMTIISVPLLGCTSVDYCTRDWELRPQTDADAASGTGEPVDGDSVRRLTIGMSKDQLRDLAGPLIEKSSIYMWKLRRQFGPFAPGLYPYFDSREVYLYFDEDDTEALAPIIVRGAYNVYP